MTRYRACTKHTKNRIRMKDNLIDLPFGKIPTPAQINLDDERVHEIAVAMSQAMTLGDADDIFFSEDLLALRLTVARYLGTTLSNIRRFCGHSHVSVARHSLAVMRGVIDDLDVGCKVHALLHDAAETFVADMPRPLKQLLPAYSEFEKDVLGIIYRALSVPLPTEAQTQAVKKADDFACRLEMGLLRGEQVHGSVANVLMNTDSGAFDYILELTSALPRIDG